MARVAEVAETARVVSRAVEALMALESMEDWGRMEVVVQMAWAVVLRVVAQMVVVREREARWIQCGDSGKLKVPAIAAAAADVKSKPNLRCV